MEDMLMFLMRCLCHLRLNDFYYMTHKFKSWVSEYIKTETLMFFVLELIDLKGWMLYLVIK